MGVGSEGRCLKGFKQAEEEVYHVLPWGPLGQVRRLDQTSNKAIGVLCMYVAQASGSLTRGWLGDPKTSKGGHLALEEEGWG